MGAYYVSLIAWTVIDELGLGDVAASAANCAPVVGGVMWYFDSRGLL
jgi:hypothetical protein